MAGDSAVVVDGGDAAPVATTEMVPPVTETTVSVEETTVTPTAMTTEENATSGVAVESTQQQEDSVDVSEQEQQPLKKEGGVLTKKTEASADIGASRVENAAGVETAAATAESAGEPGDTAAALGAMEVDQDGKNEPIEQAQGEKQADASAAQKEEPTAQVESIAVGSESAAGKRKEMEPHTAAQDAALSAQEATPKKQKTKASESVKVETSAPVPASAAAAPPVQQPQTSDKALNAAANVAPAPIMISRDDMAKMEEDGGLVKFDVITNDGTPEHMVQLTTLKNIFAKQLPKMPKEYIVRLVFDRNHRSMVILKNGTHVIGGICYRPFLPNHFAEIAFCAINAADQVKGYGTRLMNHLKEFVKQEGITHFLTYADNYAIGYFKKQGFAKVVSMPRPNWFGYIKDYDGGTLMECTIHYQIDYLRITSMVHQQRKVRHEA